MDGLKFTAEEMALFKQKFHHFDSNHDGYLSKAEFATFLQAAKIATADNEEMIIQCIDYIDENKDGKINFQEFTKCFKKVA